MTVTTATFRWTERYSVHIAALDAQHKCLFATINELNEALANGEGRAVTQSILQKLVDYAGKHFAAEESLMTKHRFPGMASHRTEHENFIHSLAKFQDGHRAGKSGVPVALILFLQNWLSKHVLETDQAYSGFLNARGVR